MQRVLDAAYTFAQLRQAHHRQPLRYRTCADRTAWPPSTRSITSPTTRCSTIAGQFDETKTLAMVAETLRRDPEPARASSSRPTPWSPRRMASAQSPCAASAIHQASWPSITLPPARTPMTPALDVLAGVLGDSPSGRLYKALVDNKKAVGAGMGVEDLHDPGFMHGLRQPQAGPVPRRSAPDLLKTVEGLVTEPPTKEEVERVKTRILKNIELELNEFAGRRPRSQRVRRARATGACCSSRATASRTSPSTTCARRQGISQGIQPHARPVHPHQDSRPRRNSGHSRYLCDAQGL